LIISGKITTYNQNAMDDADQFRPVKTPDPGAPGDHGPRLLDRVRSAIRMLHYRIRTEDAYVQWVKRFIVFHGKRHPLEMGEREVEAFLTHLAVDEDVAASTQNQAMCALLFLYKVVLERPLEGRIDVRRAKRPARLPVVLTRPEVRAVLGQLDGEKLLMASLLYGSGLRLMECLRLRVKDVDFGQNHLVVRDEKGQKDRVTLLPRSLVEPLKGQIAGVRRRHKRDVAEGFGRVYLPHALAEKDPNADREPAWQYVFPAPRRASDPRTGIERRHHLAGTASQKTVLRRRDSRRNRIVDFRSAKVRPFAERKGTMRPPGQTDRLQVESTGRSSQCPGRTRRAILGRLRSENRFHLQELMQLRGPSCRSSWVYGLLSVAAGPSLIRSSRMHPVDDSAPGAEPP
jgi:integron integrase